MRLKICPYSAFGSGSSYRKGAAHLEPLNEKMNN